MAVGWIEADQDFSLGIHSTPGAVMRVSTEADLTGLADLASPSESGEEGPHVGGRTVPTRAQVGKVGVVATVRDGLRPVASPDSLGPATQVQRQTHPRPALIEKSGESRTIEVEALAE
jgi:hypothetical protein